MHRFLMFTQMAGFVWSNVAVKIPNDCPLENFITLLWQDYFLTVISATFLETINLLKATLYSYGKTKSITMVHFQWTA